MSDTGVASNNPTALCLRDEQGAELAGDPQRWLGSAALEDERLLDRAVGPVLDIGCGPGRHVLALAGRGVEALGIDVTPSAVRLARSRGANVVEGSIFGPVSGAGTWGTALLLDGNIGIGGDPAALLARVGSVLAPGGRVLVELAAPGLLDGPQRARVEHGAVAGPWFGWASVSTACIGAIAATATLELTASWSDGGRWFAQLDAGRSVGTRNHPGQRGAPTAPGPTAQSGTASTPAAVEATNVRTAADPLLVTAVGRGEHRALEEIHRRHAGPVFAMAMRVLRARELAEDVVQGVLTRLWSHPELFDPARGSLRSFLLTKAHSQAVDIVRSERARRAREERHGVFSASCYDLEEEVLNAAMGREIREAMEALSEPERSAITLAYFGGHTYSEVACLLRVAEGTVKSRIRSGLGRLRVDLIRTAIDPR